VSVLECVLAPVCVCVCALQCPCVSVVLEMDGSACFLRDCLFGLCSGAYMAFPSGKMGKMGKMHVCTLVYMLHTRAHIADT